jgi:hypothetical protein
MVNKPNTSGSSGSSNVLLTRAALDRMKVEMANELGISLKQLSEGDVPSRVAGNMVKRMIEQQEKSMSGQGK